MFSDELQTPHRENRVSVELLLVFWAIKAKRLAEKVKRLQKVACFAEKTTSECAQKFSKHLP